MNQGLKLFFVWILPFLIALWQKGRHGTYTFDKPMFLFFVWCVTLMTLSWVNNEGKDKSPKAIFNNISIPICDAPIRAGDYLIYSDGVRASSLFLYWKLKSITVVVYNPADREFKKGDKLFGEVLDKGKKFKGTQLIKLIGQNYANAHILRKIDYDKLTLEVRDKIESHRLNKENVWIGYYSGKFEFENPEVPQIEFSLEEVSQSNNALRTYLRETTRDAESIVSFGGRVSKKERSILEHWGIKRKDDTKEDKENE